MLLRFLIVSVVGDSAGDHGAICDTPGRVVQEFSPGHGHVVEEDLKGGESDIKRRVSLEKYDSNGDDLRAKDITL